MRRPMLALLVSLGLLLQAGAGVCGTLLCSALGGALCCPGLPRIGLSGPDATGRDRARAGHAPAHADLPAGHAAMDRAPCGCCDIQTTCSSTALPDPMVETALARASTPPALPALTRAAPPRPQLGQRLATTPGQARPPPALPSPTATIVLLI